MPEARSAMMVHSQSDSLVKAQPPSIVMPDLIGHPEVHIGVQEWPHKEMGPLDPHESGGDVDVRLLLCLSAPVNHAARP